MKNLILFFGLILGLGLHSAFAQINNSITNTYAVNGNCGMCKKIIEGQGSEAKISEVKWDADSKEATITYDSTKTDEHAILKKIALAGYDNAEFRAPDAAYETLHECCQYVRAHEVSPSEAKDEHANHEHGTSASSHGSEVASVNQLQSVFNQYIQLKDALVATDAKTAAAAAHKLAQEIEKIDSKKLSAQEGKSWNEIKGTLAKAAGEIAKDTKIDGQRKSFISLSNSLYTLAKSSSVKLDLYYQYCPMANGHKGAYWLSKENSIRNPYFGSKMMSCGEVKEKI